MKYFVIFYLSYCINNKLYTIVKIELKFLKSRRLLLLTNFVTKSVPFFARMALYGMLRETELFKIRVILDERLTTSINKVSTGTQSSLIIFVVVQWQPNDSHNFPFPFIHHKTRGSRLCNRIIVRNCINSN